MNLWVFEEETLVRMADDAMRISRKPFRTPNQQEAAFTALDVLEEIVNEMRSRNYDISKWSNRE